MTGLEIILLIVGVIIFVISFIFSAKMDDVDAERKAELTDIQKESIERQIKDVFDDQVNEVKEKTEIELDRLSNVKMNEMNEYSETILSEINRNHSEVMFLYDMLNEKKKEVNNTVRDVMAVKKEINDTIKNSQIIKAETDDGVMTGEQVVQSEKPAATKKTRTTKAKNDKVSSQTEEKVDNVVADEVKTTKRKRKTTAKVEKADDIIVDTSSKTNEVDNQSASVVNNNEKILKLHAEGKSVVEIAKELGLGIGEVKLVIDLFRGGK